MDRIKFKINAEEYSVGSELSAETTLLDYLRDMLQFTDTKYMCKEAGCGACIVAVRKPGDQIISVNACMALIHTCQDWEIFTIQSIGNKVKGYHPLQQVFAEKSASQCGYCTPGWIMHMFALINSEHGITMKEIEESFGSNICRCTGYRPIIEALRCFSRDKPNDNVLVDMEDLKLCKKTKQNCSKHCVDADWCHVSVKDTEDMLQLNLVDNKKWFAVRNVSDIFQILKREGTDSYILVQGNTARVPYPQPDLPRIIINISGVEELKGFCLEQNLTIGAGVTITEFMDILTQVAECDGFEYLEKILNHLKKVAHIPVRNLGSVAGNLMIKHQHHEFPSDIYLLLTTVGADLTILDMYENKEIVTMEQFLQKDMKGKVIMSVKLPPLNQQCKLVTYKIMARSQSVQATVNAGFLYKVRPNGTLNSCTIVYGNLSPSFIRATKTESYLKNKILFSNQTLRQALNILKNELLVIEMPPETSADFRKGLALNLLYKGLLSLCPEELICRRLRSGVENLSETRPLLIASQEFDTNDSLWPLNEPMPKLEALKQTAGEVHYVDDIPKIAHEAYITYVTATVSNGYITNIDPSKALECPGVLAFYSANDFPGTNRFAFEGDELFLSYEEFFCERNVEYFDQPLGIIVAVSELIAKKAAKMVKVTYEGVNAPVLTIDEAIKDPQRVTLHSQAEANERGDDVTKVIKHEVSIYSQYHFPMETLVCLARPSEEGLQVFATTQWPDGLQTTISQALGIDINRIDLYIRRLGGGFGIKLSRPAFIAVSCCLAAYKLNQPCRFVHSLRDNTRTLGKRLPCRSEFEFAVNSSGVIQYSELNMYEDNGYKVNEDFYLPALESLSNCYKMSRWNYKCYNVLTDTPKNTWFRGPGTLETIAMAECKMERIAYEMSLDPLQVRVANLDPKYNDLLEMIDHLKTEAEYDKRRIEVDIFNKCNRWKKRGLRFCIMKWNPVTISITGALLTVYHGDGSVALVHGGIEVGQGINTNAAQICAHMLNIPIEKIQVKGTDTITAPNNFMTGTSMTTHNVCAAVKKCCEELLERLSPIKKKLGDVTWKELISNAHKANIDLQTRGVFRQQDYEPYIVYGVTLSEVTVDVLTGECEIERVDLLEDVGRSINPSIDVGQVEGAFVMGIGYWTCEKVMHNKITGELLTDRAWNYHVPLMRDIPRDFRVYLRKKSYSNDLAFGSKCVGEPPICMAVGVTFAIREALSSAREDAGIPSNKWFNIDGPFNLENIGMATGTKLEDLVFC